jgi:hypothetical protein
MSILILSVSTSFYYKLYSEYVLSISLFFKKYFNKNSDIYFNNTEIVDSFKIDTNKYDTIIYFGDITYFNKNISNDNYKNIYYVNIEPLTRISNVKNIHKLNKNIHILDYSEENISLYENYFSKINLLFPYFSNIDVNKNDKIINVLAISNCAYRDNIIKKIDNVQCKTVRNCFGKARDDLFKQSKIYINIHSNEDNKIIESIRLNNLVINKVIVISHSTINSKLYYFNKYIIFCDTIDEIKAKIDEILNNYDEFYDNFFKNFSYDNYIEYIKQNLCDIINI